VFGEAVNVAAHMTRFSKSDQIITCQRTVSSLNSELKVRCERIDDTLVGGFDSPIGYYQIK